MDYNINMGVWGNVFIVPCAVVDDYLRMASPKAVKVLLYLMRNNGRIISISTAADAVRVSEEDVEDAVSYWEQTGLITTDAVPSCAVKIALAEESGSTAKMTEPSEAITPAPEASGSEPAAKLKKSSSAGLTPKEIADRLASSPEVKYLYAAAETIFASPLNHTQQRSLILMLDYYGLPADVILMLIQYCSSIGKTGMGYIETIARSWSEDGITDHTAAENAVMLMERSHTYSARLKSALEISRKLTSREQQYINSWAKSGISVELIVYAYEKSAEAINKLSFSYMDKMLMSWLADGITTPEAAAAASDGKKTKTAASDTSKQSSFDLDRFAQLAVNFTAGSDKQ